MEVAVSSQLSQFTCHLLTIKAVKEMKTRPTPRIGVSTDISFADSRTAIAVCVTSEFLTAHIFNQDRFSQVRELLASGGFKADEGELMVVSTIDPATGKPYVLILVGVGKKHELMRASIREAAASAVREARKHHTRELYFCWCDEADEASNAMFFAQGAVLGLYENALYQEAEDASEIKSIDFLTSTDARSLSEAISTGKTIAESMNWARELADEPGGSLPPREFSRRASAMAVDLGLTVESLAADQIRAMGMGGLWGVGKGSNEEPALIVVRYEPENSDGKPDSDDLLAFVGKGITFDTGGISIKPAKGMEEMKSDMAGGAAALGAIRAISQLRPGKRIVAIVPSAENMPSGRALKPGDIIKTLAGFTVEAVDTDAEGRLVLIDGIAYAKRLGATRIVDLATLTGSVIVALGDLYTGLFSNNDMWAESVKAAARLAGERVWRMPVGDDYKKLIESSIADFKNYGGRPDATGAALLLSKFAGETPWVHLDIAGTSWLEHETPYSPAGATGAGIPTLVELACSKKKNSSS